MVFDIQTLTATLEGISVVIAGMIGYFGVFIMAYGGLKGAILFILSFIRGKNHLPEIRIDLGKHLALGLEFLVGKDIIESIIEPTWDDLGKLAIVIILRTIVAFVLSWELREVKEELEEEKEHERALQELQRT